ncbi:MAG: hypothetical protein AAGH42_08400 [Pseudomonadota bacterium]
MKKLSLLAAASVLVMSTAANAGQLELKLKNINGNGNTAADDSIDTTTGVTTIDRPGFIIRETQTANPLHPDLPPIVTVGKIKSTGAAVADERVISEEHPFEAHFELNATRIDPDSELVEFLPDEFLLQLEVGGATFKTALNGEDLIRNGMMGEGNLDADILANTGGLGESYAEVSVVNQRDNGRQTDFGLLLPLLITGGDTDILTSCDDVQVQVQAFATVGFGGPAALGSPDTITIMTCEPSFGFTFGAKEAKIDFQTDFKSFLTPQHDPVQSLTVGSINLSIWNNLFDPKADPESLDRIVDSTDIESHEMVLQFEDLTGIESVDLVSSDGYGGVIATATLDRAAGTATFVVTPDDYEFIAETRVEDIDHDDSDEDVMVEENASAWVQLTAFEPGTPKFIKEDILDDKGVVVGTIKVPTGAGAIDHQVISIASNTLNLVEPCKERDGVTINGGAGGAKTPKFVCSIPLPTGDLAELELTGQNFGPFDWVGQGNAATRNFFRVSHLPLIDGHGEPITSLKGVMTMKNTTGRTGTTGELYDDTYKFELPFDPAVVNQGANGVYLITPGAITNILNDGGAPGAAFGTSDLSFTFFVNSAPGQDPASPFSFSENFKIDVDRLMINSDGSMVPYGDNANDSNSEHAVSGDDGRFGPKAPLKKLQRTSIMDSIN